MGRRGCGRRRRRLGGGAAPAAGLVPAAGLRVRWRGEGRRRLFKEGERRGLGKGAPREACSSRTRAAAAAVSDPEMAAGGGGAGGPAWFGWASAQSGARVFKKNNSAKTEKNSRK